MSLPSYVIWTNTNVGSVLNPWATSRVSSLVSVIYHGKHVQDNHKNYILSKMTQQDCFEAFVSVLYDHSVCILDVHTQTLDGKREHWKLASSTTNQNAVYVHFKNTC